MNLKKFNKHKKLFLNKEIRKISRNMFRHSSQLKFFILFLHDVKMRIFCHINEKAT